MPKILESAAKKIAAKGGVKEPHAVATASLQKAKVLKKGTAKLTQKGRKRSKMTSAQRAQTRKNPQSVDEASENARRKINRTTARIDL